MPADHVEVLTPPGLYGGGYGAVGMNSSLEEEAMAADGYDSPGWKRLQNNSKRSMLGQPKDSKNLIIDASIIRFLLSFGCPSIDRLLLFCNRFQPGES